MALLTNDIYIGSVADPLYHFTNAQIELGGAKGNFAVDVLSNEFPIDQFSVTVRPTDEQIRAREAFITSDNLDFITADDNKFYVVGEDEEPTPEDLAEFMTNVPFGTPVFWRVNNAFMAQGYLKSVERISKRGFKLTCTSGIGLLDVKMHPGGIYQNKPVARIPGDEGILSEIIGDALTFIPSQDFYLDGGVTITGHLPYDTARNNLHRVLFAIGAIMRTGLGIADYLIGFPMQVGADIPPSAMALQGSVQYQLPANAVEVTEHAFFETADEPAETLYESSEPVSNLLVLFDKPIVVTSMTATANLTINESHVNYAIVSGYGTLTGKPYTHTTQIRRMTNNEVGNAERIKRCTDNELVNSLNSYNVARRMLSYYGNTKTVKAKVLLGENFHMLRAGQLYNFVNPYGEVASGYLTKQDALVTSVVGSQCQFVTGYVPNANGNTFTQRLTIDASYVATHGNTWTVPQGVTYIRLVLISGGDGGQGGYDGENGLGQADMISASPIEMTFIFAYAYGEQAIPQGGDPGASGAQGKVLIAEKTVTQNEIISFTLGAGGAGGARNGGLGSPGAPTTAQSTSIGNLTSDSGVTTIGYQEPFSGDVYATPGEDGIRGGDGGRTDSKDEDPKYYGNHGGDGLKGGDAGSYKGGRGGTGEADKGWTSPDGYYFGSGSSSGGGGGGAAYGANGGNGGMGGVSVVGQSGTIVSGHGGNGGNAVTPEKPSAYGRGGGGGNGGGAGGNAGAARTDAWPPSNWFSITIGSAGVGGHGSAGGAGGDGVLLIYY